MELSRAERSIGAAHPNTGATAVGFVLDHWRISYSPAELATTLQGAALGTGLEESLMELVESKGLWAFANYSSIDDLKERVRAGFPVIVGLQDSWKKLNTRRPVVVVGYVAATDSFLVRDGSSSPKPLTAEELYRSWRPVNFWMLVACPADQPSWVLNLSELAGRARFHERRGEGKLACADYEKAMVMAPSHPGLFIALANVYRQMGQLQEAKALYRKAVAANPDDGRAANNLAFVLAEDASTLDEAVDLAQKAAALEPTNPSTLDTLGYVYLKQGNFIAAAATLERAHARSRQLPADQQNEIALHLARAHAERGQLDRARSVVNDILRGQPDFVVPPDLRALVQATPQ